MESGNFLAEIAAFFFSHLLSGFSPTLTEIHKKFDNANIFVYNMSVR